MSTPVEVSPIQAHGGNKHSLRNKENTGLGLWVHWDLMVITHTHSLTHQSEVNPQ